MSQVQILTKNANLQKNKLKILAFISSCFLGSKLILFSPINGNRFYSNFMIWKSENKQQGPRYALIWKFQNTAAPIHCLESFIWSINNTQLLSESTDHKELFYRFYCCTINGFNDSKSAIINTFLITLIFFRLFWFWSQEKGKFEDNIPLELSKHNFHLNKVVDLYHEQTLLFGENRRSESENIYMTCVMRWLLGLERKYFKDNFNHWRLTSNVCDKSMVLQDW